MRSVARIISSIPRRNPVSLRYLPPPPATAARSYASSSPFQPSPSPQQLLNPLQPDQNPQNNDGGPQEPEKDDSKTKSGFPKFGSNPAVDAVLATTVGLILVFGGGM